jgi:predicted transcriptional regulator
MTFAINITEDQLRILLEYADLSKKTIDDLMGEMIERIEDDVDTKIAEEIIKNRPKDAVLLTHEEVLKELGLK